MFFSAVLLFAVAGSGVLARPQIQDETKASTCSFVLQEDMDVGKEPVVFAVKGNKKAFAWPESQNDTGIITVKNNGQLILACLGTKNEQSSSEEQTATVTCSDGQLTIENKPISETTTSCTRTYSYSFNKVTNKTCGRGNNKGVIVHIGYQLDDEDSFYSLIDVCHNIEKESSLFSTHVLRGASLAGKESSSGRRSFSQGPAPLFPNVSPNDVYVRTGQIASFNKILGPGGADMYITPSSGSSDLYLARGHLTPHADPIYNSGMLATFWYINVGPQWQVFNDGSWVTIEEYTRDMVQEAAEDCDVITGLYGTLQLADKNGTLHDMYLDADHKGIPVPEVYWKVIHNKKTHACVVAVGHNNPYLKKDPTPICSTVKPTGWPDLTGNITRGYAYYCDYPSFRKTVNYVPQLKCNGLFEFASAEEQ